MFKKLKKFATSFALTAGVCFASALAYAQTELTMYYPVAVGGPLTKIVDGIVDDFMKENPDIKSAQFMREIIMMHESKPLQL